MRHDLLLLSIPVLFSACAHTASQEQSLTAQTEGLAGAESVHGGGAVSNGSGANGKGGTANSAGRDGVSAASAPNSGGTGSNSAGTGSNSAGTDSNSGGSGSGSNSGGRNSSSGAGGTIASAGRGGTGAGGTMGTAGKGGSSSSAGKGGTSSVGGSSSGGTGPGNAGSGQGGKAGSGSTFTYQTDFNTAQNPLSEGGVWHNNGLDWTNVVTSNGVAYGTQDGHKEGPYDDSYAILSGWPPDQYAEAVIHIESGIPAQYAEVEILLRWTDNAHYSNGYECNLAFNGQYAVIGRWPGPLGTDVSQYTVICPETQAPFAPRDGDILAAQIVGYTITSWLIRDGVKHQLCTGTDTKAGKLATGSPGIGFYWAGSPATSKYGFTSFSAHSL